MSCNCQFLIWKHSSQQTQIKCPEWCQGSKERKNEALPPILVFRQHKIVIGTGHQSARHSTNNPMNAKTNIAFVPRSKQHLFILSERYWKSRTQKKIWKTITTGHLLLNIVQAFQKICVPLDYNEGDLSGENIPTWNICPLFAFPSLVKHHNQQQKPCKSIQHFYYHL